MLSDKAIEIVKRCTDSDVFVEIVLDIQDVYLFEPDKSAWLMYHNKAQDKIQFPYFVLCEIGRCNLLNVSQVDDSYVTYDIDIANCLDFLEMRERLLGGNNE